MSFPLSPRILKGAIVGVDPANPLASVVVFQYNPDTMTRTITPLSSAGEGDRGEALRLSGPPKETIKLDVEIDATDQLERSESIATTLGIHPTLASLEMLVHPKSAWMLANEAHKLAGTIEIIPPEAPLTLLVWGAKRIVPVRLTTLTITEEFFDAALNPIRAKVSLDLRVLTYQDLGMVSIGGALSMTNHVMKEVMATIGGAGNAAALPSVI